VKGVPCRSFLMCPPTHFEVLYEINPWMHREVTVDPERARSQWEALVAVLEEAGARIEQMAPASHLPDLVFTANAGVVDIGGIAGDGRRRFVPARFRNPERQGEAPLYRKWFAERGWRIDELPPDVVHEGAGDALAFGGELIVGHHQRSDARSPAALAALTGAPVQAVKLTDPRFYHLDLTFCPLDARHALVTPEVWDAKGADAVLALVPEPLVLDVDEAARFSANSVVVGRRVVMAACPPRVGRQLEAWGFDVAVVDVGEFLKAGGGCRCLTLALDVDLAGARFS
jgi:N-dimethylarginine dimethylaminohydrolase